MKKFIRLFGFLMAVVMIIGISSVSLSAAEYTDKYDKMFNPDHPNFWFADGRFNYGVDDPNYVEYIESDENFAARKTEIMDWIYEQCPVLFLFEGKTATAVDDDTVRIPANWMLYDFEGARRIQIKYCDLQEAKSINMTLEELDGLKAEMQAVLDEAAVPFKEAEKIINAVNAGNTEYYNAEVYEEFSAIADKCIAGINAETGKIVVNFYWELYLKFRELCHSTKVYGDMNANGIVDSSDAAIILQAFAGVSKLNASQRCLINDNTTSKTATVLLQNYAGISKSDYTCENTLLDDPMKLVE